MHTKLDVLNVDAWGVPENELAPLAISLNRVLDPVSAVLLSVIGEAMPATAEPCGRASGQPCAAHPAPRRLCPARRRGR